MTLSFSFFFFFQAEDGIRDVAVTGVQTCALPILGHPATVYDDGATVDRHWVSHRGQMTQGSTRVAISATPMPPARCSGGRHAGSSAANIGTDRSAFRRTHNAGRCDENTSRSPRFHRARRATRTTITRRLPGASDVLMTPA